MPSAALQDVSELFEPEAQGQVVALRHEEIGAQLLVVAGLQHGRVEQPLAREKVQVVAVLEAVAPDLREREVVGLQGAESV